MTAIDRQNNQVPNAFMTVYTGILTFDAIEEDDDLERFEIVSYLLLNADEPDNDLRTNRRIADYGKGGRLIDAVTSAHVSVFGGGPQTCGIDSLSVDLEKHLFRDTQTREVLVLRIRAALQEGRMHRIGYKVTTLSFWRRGMAIDDVDRRDRPGLTI